MMSRPRETSQTLPQLPSHRLVIFSVPCLLSHHRTLRLFQAVVLSLLWRKSKTKRTRAFQRGNDKPSQSSETITHSISHLRTQRNQLNKGQTGTRAASRSTRNREFRSAVKRCKLCAKQTVTGHGDGEFANIASCSKLLLWLDQSKPLDFNTCGCLFFKLYFSLPAQVLLYLHAFRPVRVDDITNYDFLSHAE